MTEPAKNSEPALRAKPEPAIEADPVWDLVDKAPTQPASAHFARETVKLAREVRERENWWQRLIAPIRSRPATAIAGFAVATAAVVLAITLSFPAGDNGNVATFKGEKAEAIQEALETEMLMAAAENPSQFSDQELVYLLGF